MNVNGFECKIQNTQSNICIYNFIRNKVLTTTTPHTARTTRTLVHLFDVNDLNRGLKRIDFPYTR